MSDTDTILTHVITQDKLIFSNYYQCERVSVVLRKYELFNIKS